MAKVTFDAKKIEVRARRAAAKAIKWTAADIMRRAKGSIKSRSKRRKKSEWSSATVGDWPTAPAGSPPYSHNGWLKSSIKYRDTSTATSIEYIVGVDGKSEGGISRVLEKGGYSVQRKTLRIMGERPNRRRRKLRPDAPGKTHPVAKNGQRYLYFYSEKAWRKAAESESFQEWARQGKEVKEIPIQVTPHPFLLPATETEMARFDERLQRAQK